MSRNPKFTSLLVAMLDLHDRKNADYASDDNPYSNFEFAAMYAGITVQEVFWTLEGIKQARLLELYKSGKTPNNEAIQDSRMDKAVYTTLDASYFNEN